MQHKWKDNICVNCNIRREQKSERIETFDGFKKRFYTVYYVLGKGTMKRPECINVNQLKLHFGYGL